MEEVGQDETAAVRGYPALLHARLHAHRTKNMGLYLKELEWKCNHRLLSPDVQAVRIAGLFPADFLESWSER